MLWQPAPLHKPQSKTLLCSLSRFWCTALPRSTRGRLAALCIRLLRHPRVLPLMCECAYRIYPIVCASIPVELTRARKQGNDYRPKSRDHHVCKKRTYDNNIADGMRENRARCLRSLPSEWRRCHRGRRWRWRRVIRGGRRFCIRVWVCEPKSTHHASRSQWRRGRDTACWCRWNASRWRRTDTRRARRRRWRWT